MRNSLNSVGFAPERITSRTQDQITIDLVTAELRSEKDGLTTALQTLKFTDADIARITQLVGIAMSIASVVGWVVAAIATVKALLDFIGVLGKPKDPTQEALKQIGIKVQQIYSYLEHDSRKNLYKDAIRWRGDLSAVRNSLGNLALSRSETYFNALFSNTDKLQTAINEMLSAGDAAGDEPGNANISFLRATYGYKTTFPPSHWVDAASPLYMTRADGTPVDYSDPSRDLAATIWDPGYYLDILFEAIGLRIAALAAIEPGFRSTGHDRQVLREMYKGVVNFRKTWLQSFFCTRIVGPIAPNTDPLSGGHLIYNPYNFFTPFTTRSIAVGYVDPVSGMAILDTDYSEGFVLGYYSNQVMGGQPAYWYLTNYDSATLLAEKRRSSMFTELFNRCGIRRLYELEQSLWELIVGPLRSEFVTLTEADYRVAGDLYQQPAVEKLSLGILGSLAGKPDKTYEAHRYFRDLVKAFRVPMARRMDGSKIQLGYKLELSVGGNDGKLDVVLCDYSAAPIPSESGSLPLFPSGWLSKQLHASSATVYDVLQSALISPEEENIYEATGQIPNKTRIFENPRAGRVDLQVAVTFDFDKDDPEQPFIGHADVEIACIDAKKYPYGFILHITVYETLVAALDNGTRDEIQTQVADMMTVHFVPNFLVVEPSYFTDRAAGIAAMESVAKEITNKYVRVKEAGPLDPIERVSRAAQVEKSMIDSVKERLREAPDEMRAVLSRYEVPVPNKNVNLEISQGKL